ncbi:MAG: recombinase RecJ, partial [bacterium]|nr:recombinase RecJ [bacterium]
DAVASAYGWQVLLKHVGIDSRLVYEGEISRRSLSRMNKALGIEIFHISKVKMEPHHKVIIVDGCKGNRNVTDLVGDEIAVIDHHEVAAPDDVSYQDVRPGYGSCSTIIHSYYRQMALPPYEPAVPVPGNVATALMVGIVMDTMHFTRSVSPADLEAYVQLYPLGNVEMVNNIARNDVNHGDLKYYEYAIGHLELYKNFGFIYFTEGCESNLLGIISDFILALEEVDFVVLCARNNGMVNFSVRSELPKWDASQIIRHVLDGIGAGGGHTDMAGGVVRDPSLFDKDRIYSYFKTTLFEK